MQTLKKIFSIILKTFFAIIIFPIIAFIAFLGWLRRDKSGELVTTDKKFNLETFKSLSFPHKHKYCRRFLRYLGSGVSRDVYRLDEKKVIKLQLQHWNDRYMQNKNESYLFGKNFNHIAKVYEVGENYEWLISEYAKDIDEDKWLKLAGFSFKEFNGWIWNSYGKWHFKNLLSLKKIIEWILINIIFKLKKYGVVKISSEKIKQIEEAPFMKEIISLVGTDYPDMGKINSWGVVQDENGQERIVLRDYGLAFKRK